MNAKARWATLFAVLLILFLMNPKFCIPADQSDADHIHIVTSSTFQHNEDHNNIAPPTTSSHDASEETHSEDDAGTNYSAVCKSSRLPTSIWRPASCVDDVTWLLPWLERRKGDDKDWVLADVGANKGYVIARWLELFQGDAQHSGFKVGKELLHMGRSSTMCGACYDCLEDPPPVASHRIHSSRLRVYGFEALPANYRFLSQFFANSSSVKITHAAISNVSAATAEFSDFPLGSEIGALNDKKAKNKVSVDVLRLDSALAHEEVIHVLTTDVEGYDLHVASSAHKLLSQGRVGIYQFEMWARADYRAVFEQLASWGYTCFYPAAYWRRSRKLRKVYRPKIPQLARLTGCWRSQFSQYNNAWMNAVCANFNRFPELVEVFEKLEKTYRRPVQPTDFVGKVDVHRLFASQVRKHEQKKNEEIE